MTLLFEEVLFAFLLVVAVMVIRMQNLFAAAMLGGIFSLISAGLFTFNDAVDVAFTEAAVGAGISTILILATLALTGSTERAEAARPNVVALAVVLLTGGVLVYGTLDMPAYGDPSAPIHHHLIERYIVTSQEEIGLPNFVTSILASYRGYDTFGELAVIFTAGVGVVSLLHGARVDDEPEGAEVDASRKLRVREAPVLRAVTKALIPVVLLFALYVQFHGDFGPGGGFQAGVIFAAGLILYALVFGPSALQRVVPPRVVELGIVLGVLVYGGTGLWCLLSGYSFLDYTALNPAHPSHGQHLGILLVELGVGITVTSVMLTIYYYFATYSLDVPHPVEPPVGH